MKTYVLDACALIAVLNKEDGADVVKALLEAPTDRVSLYMNIVNLLEVYYGLIRTYGQQEADHVLNVIKSSPIKLVEHISEPIFREAARLKSSYKISLADAFALSQAVAVQGVLITSDHHEFDIVEQCEPIDFLWIR